MRRMAWWPGSLRARLTLLLLGVLLAAQLISAALHFQDRGEVLEQATGFNLTRRIAGMVQVLDRMDKVEREAFVRAMDVSPLRVMLMDRPLPMPHREADSVRADLFHRLLHFRLGEARPVMVSVPDESVANAVGGDPAAHMMQTHLGKLMARVEAARVQVRLGDGRWVLFTYQLPQELRGWPWGLVAGLGVLLIAVLLVSALSVRWLTRPLSLLAEAADQLGRDIRHAPLSEDGPLEVRRAAHAFNTMQQRLATLVEDQTRMLAAISHDLKTPLTRMRLRVEQLPDARARRCFERDLQDMQDMVQSSLDFMRGLGTKESACQVDVNALIESLCEDAAGSDAPIPVKGGARGPFVARPLALKRVIGNLLENAVRYGRTPEVVIEDTAKWLVIRVRDRGPGVPDALLERIFDPFFRIEESRNQDTGGTGLGLSIARNVTHAMGGELTVRNRRGGGLEAVLRLPR